MLILPKWCVYAYISIWDLIIYSFMHVHYCVYIHLLFSQHFFICDMCVYMNTYFYNYVNGIVQDMLFHSFFHSAVGYKDIFMLLNNTGIHYPFNVCVLCFCRYTWLILIGQIASMVFKWALVLGSTLSQKAYITSCWRDTKMWLWVKQLFFVDMVFSGDSWN